MSMTVDDSLPMPPFRKVERLAPDAPRRRSFVGTLRPAPHTEPQDDSDAAAVPLSTASAASSWRPPCS